MIKTTVIPKTNNYKIDLPLNYVGKRIEILVYAIDELMNEKEQMTIIEPKNKTYQLNKEQQQILDEQLNNDKSQYLEAEELYDKLKNKYGL